MRKLLICSVLAAAMMVSGCDFLTTGGGDGGRSGDITLLGEQESVENLSADRATIQDVRLTGGTLNLEVTYSGGCQEHEFSLYASRGFVKTIPPLVEVFLAHDANGDACRALITEQLSFDVHLLEHLFLQLHPKGGAFIVNLHEPTGEEGTFKHIDPRSPLYQVR